MHGAARGAGDLWPPLLQALTQLGRALMRIFFSSRTMGFSTALIGEIESAHSWSDWARRLNAPRWNRHPATTIAALMSLQGHAKAGGVSQLAL